MITSDYKIAPINPVEYQDLKEIAGVAISGINLDDYSNLLVFPDSFEEYDRDFGKKMVCEIVEEKKDNPEIII